MSQNYLPDLTITGDSGIDLVSVAAASDHGCANSVSQTKQAPDQIQSLVDSLAEATSQAGNSNEVTDGVVAAAFKSVGFGPMMEALQSIA